MELSDEQQLKLSLIVPSDRMHHAFSILRMFGVETGMAWLENKGAPQDPADFVRQSDEFKARIEAVKAKAEEFAQVSVGADEGKNKGPWSG